SAGFIAPCLPSPAPQPPSGERWLHEIKQTGSVSLRARTASGCNSTAGSTRGQRLLPSGQGPAGETRSDNRRLSFRSVDTGTVSYESSVDLRMGTEVEKLASRSSSRAAERMR